MRVSVLKAASYLMFTAVKEIFLVDLFFSAFMFLACILSHLLAVGNLVWSSSSLHNDRVCLSLPFLFLLPHAHLSYTLHSCWFLLSFLHTACVFLRNSSTLFFHLVQVIFTTVQYIGLKTNPNVYMYLFNSFKSLYFGILHCLFNV